VTDGDRPAQRQTLETVGVYASITEASIVRERLEQAGIRSWLQNELTAGQLFQVGLALGGVTLQVASDDLQRAEELIAESGESAAGEAILAWTCPRCGSEVDAGFEICWSCQAPGTGT
jgi:hypothetical protein